MTVLVTSAQMRAIERAAIESQAVTGATLMERAGAGTVAALFDRWPPLARGMRRAVVLCGPGNNGGDGFVIARLLRERGWAVEVLALGEAARSGPDARTMRARWAALGPVAPLAGPGDLAATPAPDLIVDAVFGTGLSRPLHGVAAGALRAVADWRAGPAGAVPMVAVDLPSGLCADTGRARGPVLRCDLTVTFHRAKPGHYLAEGPAHCGALSVVDIGLTETPADATRLIGAAEARPALDKAGGHKFDHGHVVVPTGAMGRTGAARLAARAALRVGAGLVSLGAPAAAMAECAAQVTAVMLRRVDGREDLEALLGDARINALCLGPGLGVARARDLMGAVRGKHAPYGGALVLDADALTALAPLEGLLPGRCVLTPHGGEFARLFPDLAASEAGKIERTRAAARRAGCVVLNKGPDTVIAAPDGRTALQAATGARRVPWLATAGAGDVLAGLIAGLLARGMAPFEAACAAAWIHVEAAVILGPGLIAEDLPEALPRVLRALA
ncbi:MAG: NAD(P)H-hydrate dehydratase [Rhodobacteraceae bacterium]|nr:NAD(P)H-hydrate dehydratase [Paracoccaceae bacterium]